MSIVEWAPKPYSKYLGPYIRNKRSHASSGRPAESVHSVRHVQAPQGSRYPNKWEFPKIRATLFWGPYIKDPTI